MKELMKREVPIDSDEKQVLIFFKAQNIPENLIIKENNYIRVILRDVSSFLVCDQDLNLAFILDSKEKVSDYSVEIQATCL